MTWDLSEHVCKITSRLVLACIYYKVLHFRSSNFSSDKNLTRHSSQLENLMLRINQYKNLNSRTNDCAACWWFTRCSHWTPLKWNQHFACFRLTSKFRSWQFFSFLIGNFGVIAPGFPDGCLLSFLSTICSLLPGTIDGLSLQMRFSTINNNNKQSLTGG